MEQKRFITADEVFQLFGVDATALEGLVTSGAVTPLADQGSFKYRREDFAELVKNGTLSPRTSAESFQVDSDGDIPFLKLKREQADAPVDDGVSFLELDEDALNEHANPDTTMVSPSVDKWFEDSEESLADLVYSEDSATAKTDKKGSELRTEFELSGEGPAGLPDSDSDVRIVGLATPAQQNDEPESPTTRELDASRESLQPSDSDVVLAFPSSEAGRMASSESMSLAESDSDVRVLQFASSQEIEAVDSDPKQGRDSSGKADDSEIIVIASDSDSDVRLAGTVESGHDAAVSITSDTDSGISLIDAESGIRLSDDQGGISLTDSDSGISLVGADSGIQLVGDDSGIRLTDADSGISLVGAGADSGISLVGAESDSGISLADDDSGITLEDDAFDPSPTIAEGSDSSSDFDANEVPYAKSSSDSSGEFLQDSGFDVNLVEEDATAELNFRDSDAETPGFPATIVFKGSPQNAPQVTAASLSETFELDEPPEVEDLDISEDLEGASGSESSDEFAAVEEDEVFEASDDDFSEADVSVAEIDEMSDEEVLVPAAKVRKGPTEPEWGLAAIAPIAIAALMMLTTVTVLWGGVTTMWTGREAPGPAATLISTLAGLSPF